MTELLDAVVMKKKKEKKKKEAFVLQPPPSVLRHAFKRSRSRRRQSRHAEAVEAWKSVVAVRCICTSFGERWADQVCVAEE